MQRRGRPGAYYHQYPTFDMLGQHFKQFAETLEPTIMATYNVGSYPRTDVITKA